MWIADKWKDYEVIDCSKGEKLARWGEQVLIRPDPQVIWDTKQAAPGWRKPDAHYHRMDHCSGRSKNSHSPPPFALRW